MDNTSKKRDLSIAEKIHIGVMRGISNAIGEKSEEKYTKLPEPQFKTKEELFDYLKQFQQK